MAEVQADSTRHPLVCGRFYRNLLKCAAVLSLPLALFLLFAPSLLLEHREGGNESNAVAALRSYERAERAYRQGNPQGEFAQSLLPLLAGGHIAAQLAKADGGNPQAQAFQGYLFVPVVRRNGTLLNPKSEVSLCAYPAAWDRTGINTFILVPDGTILMKDTQGKPVRDLAELDDTWVTP